MMNSGAILIRESHARRAQHFATIAGGDTNDAGGDTDLESRSPESPSEDKRAFLCLSGWHDACALGVAGVLDGRLPFRSAAREPALLHISSLC